MERITLEIINVGSPKNNPKQSYPFKNMTVYSYTEDKVQVFVAPYSVFHSFSEGMAIKCFYGVKQKRSKTFFSREKLNTMYYKTAFKRFN